MSNDPYLGEIDIFSFNFAPRNFATADGQTLPINQNQALFSLLGTNYGGNGQTTFQLPNLKGRVAMHLGNGHSLAETGGSSAVTVNIQQLPTHLHPAVADNANADGPLITGARLGGSNNLYRSATTLTALGATSITSVGGSQPHNNMSPYLVINFCIALIGIFPSQN